MCTCGLALKDGAKVQGWQKTDSGIVGIGGDKGGYGWIKGDMMWILVVWRGRKMEGVHPDYSENRSEWGKKKKHGKRDGACRGYN